MSISQRIITRGLLLFLLFASGLYSIPFFFLLKNSPDQKSRLGEKLVFHVVAQKQISKRESAEEKVIHLTNYVNRYILAQFPTESVD